MRHQAVTYRVLRCRELWPTVSHARDGGPAPRPDLLRGALLLALLGSEDQDAAGKHRRSPPQDALLLLLELGHVTRRVAGRYGSAFGRLGAAFGRDLGAQHAAVRGG